MMSFVAFICGFFVVVLGVALAVAGVMASISIGSYMGVLLFLAILIFALLFGGRLIAYGIDN